jgi:hypothetical protein
MGMRPPAWREAPRRWGIAKANSVHTKPHKRVQAMPTNTLQRQGRDLRSGEVRYVGWHTIGSLQSSVEEGLTYDQQLARLTA